MIRSTIRWSIEQVRSRLLAGVAHQEDLDRLYDQIAGLMQIQSAMGGTPILKPMRGWALSPDAMGWILTDLQERSSPTVVEFGCGQSTVILAAWIKNRGAGRLTSFEHDPAYAAAIRRQLEACGLASQVDLQVVPLVEYPAVGALPPCQSYALPDRRDLAIDVALVDGPPYWAGDATRYHPLRWAADRLSPDGAVYLDDTIRAAEQGVVRELCLQVPAIVTENLKAEKGLTRGKRGSAG
ncbi:MAG: class I SAM-dependent methyltransferase [Vicinamibacterales bacterium]